MDEQGEGGVQAGGLEGGFEAMGAAQEQARYELRDDGKGSEVRIWTVGWGVVDFAVAKARLVP